MSLSDLILWRPMFIVYVDLVPIILNLARMINVLTFLSRSRMEMYIGDTDILLKQTRSLTACGICWSSLDRYKSNVVWSFGCLLYWFESNEITPGKLVLTSDIQHWEMYLISGILDYHFRWAMVSFSNELLMFVSIPSPDWYLYLRLFPGLGMHSL